MSRPVAGGLLLLGYVAVLVAAGAMLVARRDVTQRAVCSRSGAAARTGRDRPSRPDPMGRSSWHRRRPLGVRLGVAVAVDRC